MASPRGRLWLARAIQEGEMGLSRAFVTHLDRCVGCLACQTACPSGVPYGRILESARAAIAAEYRRGAPDRALRWLLTNVFPFPNRWALGLGLLAGYQRLGLSRLARRTHLWKRVSPALAAMEALLPPIPSRAERSPLPAVTVPAGTSRGRVGLLTGCAQRHLLPGINRATVRVLGAAGFEVRVPREQGCCGAIHIHTGLAEDGKRLARSLMQTFEPLEVDLVVANAAGCGAQMKAYGHLLSGDPAWAARAAAFSRKVRDVSEILAETRWNGRLRPVPLTVAYHDACHLAHGQRIRNEPRAMLRQIPDLELRELAESEMCCGSGGVYNILEPAMADRLLRRKVEHIRATGAAAVAAANIGCLLQIRRGLEAAGLPIRAVHPVEILDWALHGERA
jgi:glycolate oxidase iron-sulfur subunit